MSENLHETELLSKIASRLSMAEDVASFVEGIMEPVAQLFGAEGVGIWLFDPISETLSGRGYDRLSAADLKVMDYHIDDEAAIPGIFRSTTTVFSSDVSNDQRINLDRLIGDLGYHSLMALPVQARQQSFGVVMLGSAEAGAFEEDQLGLLKAISGQIGAVAHGATVHHDLRRRTDLMAQINRIGSAMTGMSEMDSILEHVCHGLHLNLHYDVAQIWLRKGPELVLRARGIEGEVTVLEEGPTRAVTDGIVGRSARTSRSFIVRDLRLDPDFSPSEGFDKMRSALQVPVISGDKVIGVLDLVHQEIGAFDESDRQAIETLAAQMAIAVENVRLNEDTRQRMFQQAIVHQISQDLITIFDVPSLAEAVVFQMAQALDTTGCLLSLLDESSQAVKPQAFYVSAQAKDPDALDQRLDRQYSLDELSVVRQAFTLGSPIELQASGEGDFPLESDLLVRLNQLSSLVVPLMTSGHQIGVIAWLEDRHPRSFNENEVRLAQILANQASVALEHARLHDATQRQLSRETVLRKMAETANSWADQHSMMEQFAVDTNLALGTSLCNIYLFEGDGPPSLVMQQVAEGTKPPAHVESNLDLAQYPAIRDAIDRGETLYLYHDDLDESSPEKARLLRLGYVGYGVAPLIYRETLVGVLEVWDRRDGYRIPDEHINLLESLAGQVSIAIDSARQYTREQQRRTLLERVQETSQLISGALDHRQLMRLITERVVAVFEIEAALIALFDEETQEFRIQASHGISDEFKSKMRLTYANYETLMGTVGSVRVLEDVQGLPINKNFALMHHENLRTVLMIPLMHGERILGLLSAGTVGYVRKFSHNELEMAQLLGRQIAIAINNAQLFEVVEERAAALAEANRLKTEFLANISHELRTPMNSVIGFSQSLTTGMYGELNEQQKNRVDIVLRNAEHLLALIDDMLDLSKIDAGRVELQLGKVLVGDMLSAIYNEMGQAFEDKGLSLSSDLPNDLPAVYADERRLRQVFINLLSNAFKFTDEGKITVTARPEEVNGGAYVRFSVKDTGMGIEPANLEVIFDAFRQADGSSTREHGGTGMGLTITRRLVELMSGSIWVESVVGKGSTFHVLMPVEANTSV